MYRAAAALLVVLAGCAGVTGPSTPTGTVTPAPVPGDDPSAVAGTTLPPGVTEVGVEDPDALARAHVRAAAGRSYRLAIVVRTERVGETTVETFRARVANDSTYLATVGTADGTTRTVYVEGNRIVVRRAGDPPQYERRPTTTDPPAAAIAERAADAAARYLSLGRATVQPVSVYGITVVRIEGRGAERVTGTIQYDALAYVEPSGFVRVLQVQYQCTTDRPCRRVTVVVEHQAVNRTTVSRPAWYEEAIAATANESARAAESEAAGG